MVVNAVARGGKRSLPATVSNDSDEDEVQFLLHVKRPRISKNEAKEGLKMSNILTYLEKSPRLKRFLKAVLSSLGIRYGDENNIESGQDLEEEWDNVPDQEENQPPVPQYLAENLTDKIKYSSAAHFQNTCRKIGNRTNTFISLRQTPNTRAKLPDSFYAQHEERNFQSKHNPDMPFKCSLDQDEGLKRVTKSVNGTGRKHNSVACGDSTNVFSDDCGGDVNRDETPFLHDIDDIQLLFDENKPSHIHTSAFNGQQHLNGSMVATSIAQSNGLQNIEFCDSKIVRKVQDTKSAYFQHRLCEKIPYTLRSRRYRQSRPSPKMSFTTDEVVRIQEKEQYQELLQRCCSEQWQHQDKPKFTRNASVQVNMDELNINDNHLPHRYRNFHQCMVQSGFSSAGARKNLSTSELNKVSQENDEPMILEAKPNSFDTESYSRPFGKKSTTCSFVNSSKSSTVSSSFPDVVEMDDILRTVVNGNKSEHGQHHQDLSPYSSDYNTSSKEESLNSKESPDVIFEGVKPKAKAKQLNHNTGHSSHHHGKESQFTSTKPSEEYDFPEVIFEDAKQSPIPCSKRKDSIFGSNMLFQSCQFSSTRDNLPKKSPDFSEKSEYFRLENTESKPKLKRSVISSTSWIQELRETMEEEGRERQKFVADQELQLIEYKKIQADKYAEFKKLLDKEEMETPDIICLEKEPSLPRLTPEMDDIIDQALIPRCPKDVMSAMSNFIVLWKDIDTLSGSNWLNDEIINCYMFLIQERSKQGKYPSVYAFTSFFYPKLKSHGFAAVKRWTRKVDIFGFDLLLIPLHLGVHWCLAVVDLRYKKIQYYDSMDANENCLMILRDYLTAECTDKKKQNFDLSGWILEKMKNIPPQLNGSDCGMFTLKYAEYITRNVEINFTQQNMQYFRRKMIYEIITGNLT